MVAEELWIRKRHARTGEEAENRDLSATADRDMLAKALGLGQRADGGRHVQQAGEENAEADGYIADRLGLAGVHRHDQQNPDNRGDAAPGLRA